MSQSYRLFKAMSSILSIHVAASVRSRMRPNAGRDCATRLITGGSIAFCDIMLFEEAQGILEESRL